MDKTTGLFSLQRFDKPFIFLYTVIKELLSEVWFTSPNKKQLCK